MATASEEMNDDSTQLIDDAICCFGSETWVQDESDGFSRILGIHGALLAFITSAFGEDVALAGHFARLIRLNDEEISAGVLCSARPPFRIRRKEADIAADPATASSRFCSVAPTLPRCLRAAISFESQADTNCAITANYHPSFCHKCSWDRLPMSSIQNLNVALSIAVVFGHFSSIEALLKAAGSQRLWFDALETACGTGQPATIRFLLSIGESLFSVHWLSLAERSQREPLLEIIFKRYLRSRSHIHLSILKVLVPPSYPKTHAFVALAAQAGSVSAIRALHEFGFPVDNEDDAFKQLPPSCAARDFLPLVAALSGTTPEHTESVKFLLTRGVSLQLLRPYSLNDIFQRVLADGIVASVMTCLNAQQDEFSKDGSLVFSFLSSCMNRWKSSSDPEGRGGERFVQELLRRRGFLRVTDANRSGFTEAEAAFGWQLLAVPSPTSITEPCPADPR